MKFLGIVSLIAAIGGGGYWAVHQAWPCDENIVSSMCAKSLLRDKCGKERDIESIINIEYTADSAVAKQNLKTATVTYEFKYIPEPGKVSTAATMRGSSVLFYDKDDQKWIAFCE